MWRMTVKVDMDEGEGESVIFMVLVQQRDENA
jgi:hypothetical protein